MKTALIVLGVLAIGGFAGYELLLKPKLSVKKATGPMGGGAPQQGGSVLGSLSRTFGDFSSLASGLSGVTGAINSLGNDFSSFGS